MSIKGESRLLFLPVFDHLTCAPALSAVVIFNFAQTFILHKRTRPTFLGSLTLVEGKAPRKRVMSQRKHFWSTHSQTQTFTHAQLAHSHPPLLLSCIVLLIRPRRFNVKHNLYLGGKTSLSLPFWVRLCVRPGWCVNGPGKQQGSIGRGLGCLLKVSEQEWRESGMEQGSKPY